MVISVISLQQKNVPVREETGYIIIYLIVGVRMIIFGWGLSILCRLYTSRGPSQCDGEHTRGKEGFKLWMVSAWSAANGISLGQVKVDYKSSETSYSIVD